MKLNKKINLLFLSLIIISLVGEVFVVLLSAKSIELPIVINLILSQCLILLPALIFIVINKNSYDIKKAFKKIKFTSVLMFVVYTGLCMPLAYTSNIFSQLFTTNELIGVSDKIMKAPFIVVFLIVGIAGPFSEELVFRGVIFRGLRSSTGRIVASALASALFFGLMHMNLNQCCYAFVLGIVFALTDDALDSIWPSVIMHCLINSENVLMMYGSEYILNKSGTTLNEAYQHSISKSMILLVGIMFFFIMLVTTSLAVLLLYGICLNEGKVDRLKDIIKKKELEIKEKTITTAGVVTVIVCVFIMFFLEPVTKLIVNYFN